MYDPNALKIYTDGSASPNPGCGGVGMVAVYPDDMGIDDFDLSEGYELTTNNRMELLAVIRAFEWVQNEMQTKRFTRVIIITDSEYVHNNHPNAPYWKAGGWRTKDGKPYDNPDLWDAFLKEWQKTKVRIDLVWSKGKQSDILKRVDALAKAGSKNPTKVDRGFNAGKFTASRTKNPKAATLFPAQGQEAYIRVYSKKVHGRNEKQIYEVTFDLYDKSLKSYVAKHVAYTGEHCPYLERNHCYFAVFNDNPKFPQILGAEGVEYLKG